MEDLIKEIRKITKSFDDSLVSLPEQYKVAIQLMIVKELMKINGTLNKMWNKNQKEGHE